MVARTASILSRMSQYSRKDKQLVCRYIDSTSTGLKGRAPSLRSTKQQREADLEVIRERYLGSSRRHRMHTEATSTSYKQGDRSQLDRALLLSRDQLSQGSLFLNHSRMVTKRPLTKLQCLDLIPRNTLTPAPTRTGPVHDPKIERPATQLESSSPPEPIEHAF